jgi:hypothetical protein
MLRGGAFGIIGDFMFSGMNRFGNSPVEYLAGPGADLANAAVLIPMAIRRGQPVGGDILKLVRSNLPLSNMFYTKIALDYLISQSCVPQPPGAVEGRPGIYGRASSMPRAPGKRRIRPPRSSLPSVLETVAGEALKPLAISRINGACPFLLMNSARNASTSFE